MIHAHHFHFVDQPTLQEEYASFGFKSVVDQTKNVICVEEIVTYKGFENRTVMRYLSGRASFYLSDTLFDKITANDDWGLEIEDVLTLIWDASKKRILYGRGKLFTSKLLQFWIFHTFFPIALELQREYKMLHVGAVEVEGSPILFSGPSFAGKSTMTDFFLQQGHTLFSDDTLPVKEENGAYVVYPSFPYHRPYREPETLGYRVDNFARKPAVIKAVFDLVSVAPDAPVEIHSPKGIARFKSVFYSGFIKFSFMKKERLIFFSAMAQSIPVYQINIPWDKDRLPEVYDAITQHVKTL